jgi:hypothetical protein
MYYLEIETPRRFRKPLREGFLNGSDTKSQVRATVAKYRPKAKIVCILEIELKEKVLFL